MRERVLGRDDVSVSFDVVSLFTNIPINIAVEVATSRLEPDTRLTARTTFNIDDIAILLRFCLCQTHFSFSDVICH